jgi:hypothetical protein
MNVVLHQHHNYLSGNESLVASLDFSGIDLELGSPASDQVLLEGGEATLRQML